MRESTQEGAQPLLGLVDRRVGFHVGEVGHGRLSALEVTGVDQVHGRLDGGQIGLQCLEFGVVDVGISHAGESYLMTSLGESAADAKAANDEPLRPMTTANDNGTDVASSLGFTTSDNQQIMSTSQLEDPNISYMCLQMKQKYMLTKRLLS